MQEKFQRQKSEIMEGYAEQKNKTGKNNYQAKREYGG